MTPNPPSVAFHREPPSGTLLRLLVDSGIPRGIAATVDAALRADGYRVVKLVAFDGTSRWRNEAVVVDEELW